MPNPWAREFDQILSVHLGLVFRIFPILTVFRLFRVGFFGFSGSEPRYEYASKAACPELGHGLPSA